MNNNRLCFQMFSFDGELSEENKELMQAMVDSIQFDSLIEAGPLALNQSKSTWLDWFAPKYLPRNIVIFAAIGAAWYYISKGLRKRRK